MLVLRVSFVLENGRRQNGNNNSGLYCKESVDLSSFLSPELPKTIVKQSETLGCAHSVPLPFSQGHVTYSFRFDLGFACSHTTVTVLN